MTDKVPDSHLDIKTKVGYAFGHACNDIFLAIVYTYAMFFYQNVIHIGKSNVGMIYFIGQVADAVSSPIVGILSDLDLDFWLCRTYGQRKVNLSQWLLW